MKKYTLVSGQIKSHQSIKTCIDNTFEDTNDMDYILDQFAEYMDGQSPIYTGEVCGLNVLSFEREPDVWERNGV